MARPREFNADVVLDRMTQSFWVNGYEATSIDDLCEASGLSRSSLYSAFGDKHEVFIHALTHYIEHRIGNIQNVLLARPLRDALGTLAHKIIDDIIAGPGRRGCFIGNCAAEIRRGDRKAMALVREGLAKTEAAFRGALSSAQERGEIPASADLDALARFLVASFQGLRLVGKVNPDRQVLQDIAATILRCLD
jgi:TetR/AcrR family transcriptional regulator, transcriptional repressor for nem operon